LSLLVVAVVGNQSFQQRLLAAVALGVCNILQQLLFLCRAIL
jgi:hypothetical protein